MPKFTENDLKKLEKLIKLLPELEKLVEGQKKNSSSSMFPKFKAPETEKKRSSFIRLYKPKNE